MFVCLYIYLFIGGGRGFGYFKGVRGWLDLLICLSCSLFVNHFLYARQYVCVAVNVILLSYFHEKTCLGYDLSGFGGPPNDLRQPSLSDSGFR